MANRLTRIVTRTGDDGSTGLGDGRRVSKNDARVHALGEVDELNCALGVLLAEALPDEIRAIVVRIQHDLFDLGGELSIPGHALLGEDAVAALEEGVAVFNTGLPPLREFILPGGSRAGAMAHLSRAIARRAERAVTALREADPAGTGPVAQQYLNRCSDLLFVLARHLNKQVGAADVLWLRHGRD